MNEKIQQLVKQANREIGEQVGQPGVYLDFGPAKYFAELIIRECADACLAATKEESSVHLVSVAYADAVKKTFWS